MTRPSADVPAGTSRGRNPKLDRARGCLIGQLAGDSLGSLVEFQTTEAIRRRYPDGVRDLEDGGTYDPSAANGAYVEWLDSHPFDCGLTIRDGLLGNPRHASQANGALMRISPLGIFGASHPLDAVARWAREDARLTHPNRVCLDANALFAMGLTHAIDRSPTPHGLYERIVTWANEAEIRPAVRACVEEARVGPPEDCMTHMGWVLIALRNALWQLRHAPSLEEGVIDSVMKGGDTDTNAAICGALPGAVHGLDAVPARWTEAILRCRPEAGRPGVRRPRPEVYWPIDALNLVAQLVRPHRPAT